jgi:lysophospholipase L1-like esterase
MAFGRIVAVGAMALIGFSTIAASSPEPPPTAGLGYVALGDSYAAGYGLAPKTGKPVAGCLQSSIDYPHLVAKALQLRLADVTCGGAVTANLVSTPQKIGSAAAPPQSSKLNASTRVVTITIGGNDLGFVNAMKSCVALTAHGPILATGRLSCRATFVTSGVDSLARRISDTVDARLASAFAAVRANAPNAKVFVIGYLAVMPDAAHTPAKGCFAGSFTGGLTSLDLNNAYPYTNTDVAYLHSIEVALDNATRVAATHAGFHYISDLAASEAHTPCGATPWVKGVTVHSTNLAFSLQPGALHPNALGERELAASVIPQIRAAFPKPAPTPTPTPTPSVAPAPSAASPSLLPWYLSLGLIIIVIVAGGVAVIRRRKAQ